MPEEIAVNEKGGMQTRLDTRFDLLPPAATRSVAEVLAYGAKKYATNNWRLIGTNDHINHALTHIFNFLDLTTNGKTVEAYSEQQAIDMVNAEVLEEIGHFACRALMALEVYLVGEWEAGDPRIGRAPQVGSADNDKQVSEPYSYGTPRYKAFERAREEIAKVVAGE